MVMWRVLHLKLDIALLSISGDEEVDSEIVRDMVSVCGDAPLLVLLGTDDEDFRLQVIRLGAKNAVPKTKPALELQKAIQEIHLARRSEQTLGSVSIQVLPCNEKKRLLAAHNNAFNIYIRLTDGGVGRGGRNNGSCGIRIPEPQGAKRQTITSRNPPAVD